MSKTKQQKDAPEVLSSLPRIKDWHAILTLIGAVAIFFRDILLQKAFFWEDFLYYFYPVRNFAAVAFAGGELPLWNPYTFNGMPFQADVQTAIFYLPNFLLTLFVSDSQLSFYWVEVFTILHYIAAGVFMYYLAKNYGLQPLFALFCGLVYALSGFMIAHAIHYTIICEAAWFPLIVLLFWKSLNQKSYLHMIAAGLVFGLTILAGFPQVSLYILLFLFLFFLFEFFTHIEHHGIRSSLWMIPMAAGTILIAFGITGIQLLPTLELAPYSQRAEITYQKSLVGSLNWEQLITLVIPKFFGSSGAQESTYWGPGHYYYYWETCCYIGIAGIASVLFAGKVIRKNWRAAFLLWIALFSLLYALGDNFFFHKLFFFFVPGFDKFRDPGRILLLFTFSMALLSGFGLRQAVELMDSQKKQLQRILVLVVGVGASVWLSVQLGMFQPSRNPQAYEQIHRVATAETTTALVFILFFCGIMFLMFRARLSPSVAIIAVAVIQFIDINVFGFNQNNGALNANKYFERTSQIVKPLQEEGKTEFFRVNARGSRAMILDRNQGMVDRIFLMEGYTPLVLQRIYTPGRDWNQVCDMLNAKYRIVVDEQQRTMNLRVAPTYLPRAYVVYDAKVIQNDSLLQAFMRSDEFDHTRTVVLEEEPQIPPTDALGTKAWSATITSYKLNSISLNVSTPQNGILVLSEIYYPGWNAYVDGRAVHIYRANWNLRAVALEPGDHTVVFEFRPTSLRYGLWVSAVSFALCLAIAYFSKLSTRKAVFSILQE